MFSRWRSCAGLLLFAGVLLGGRTATAGAPGAAREIPKEEISKILQKARSAPTAQERVDSIRTLGGLEPAVIREFQIVKMLVDLAKSAYTGARERKALLEALRAIRLRDRSYHPQVSEIMSQVLTDPNELVILRIEAIETFQRMIENPENPAEYTAVKAILRIAKEETEPVLRAKALEAVGEVAPREGGIEALRTGVMDKDPVVRRAAVQALPRYLEKRAASGNLSPMIGLLQQLALDKELPAEVRVMAMDGLGGLARRSANPAEIARALRPVLEGAEDADVAEGAARALGLAADREAVEALSQAFGRFKGAGGGEKVRIACCASLGEMFDDFARNDIRSAERVAALLLKALQEPEEVNSVRRAAVYAIGNMNQRIYDRTEAVRVLIEVVLNDKTADKGLRGEIQESLGFLGVPASQGAPEDWKAWFERNKHLLRGRR